MDGTGNSVTGLTNLPKVGRALSCISVTSTRMMVEGGSRAQRTSSCILFNGAPKESAGATFLVLQ